MEGVARRKKTGVELDLTALAADLPEPDRPALDAPWDLLITGVGGTGVITVGQLVTMAAHLEARGASVLDFTGFAQKFGPVLSYVRLAPEPGRHQTRSRIDTGAADALIGCDIVVSSSAQGLFCPIGRAMKAAVNLAEMPTGDIVRVRDASLRTGDRLVEIEKAAGSENVSALDANRLSGAG